MLRSFYYGDVTLWLIPPLLFRKKETFLVESTKRRQNISERTTRDGTGIYAIGASLEQCSVHLPVSMFSARRQIIGSI